MKKIYELSLLAVAVLVFSSLWTAAQEQRPEDAELPAFPAGHQWSEYHAVVQTPNYDAFLPLKGGLIVQPKNGDEKIAEPLVFCGWSINYTSAPHTHHRRWIKEYTNDPKPDVNPKRVLLEGIARDPEGPDKSEVKFSVRYDFSRDRIEFTWGMEDPRRDLQFPSRFHINTSIPPSHNFAASETMDERKTTLEKYLLQVQSLKDNRRRRMRHPYNEVLIFENPLDRVIIEGHWAPRTIEMEAKGASFHGWIYSGNCPWQGYRFGRSSGQERINRQRFSLSIK